MIKLSLLNRQEQFNAIKRKAVTTVFLILLKTNIFGQGTCPITYSVITTAETCTGCCDGSIQIANVMGGCTLYFFTLNGQFGTTGSYQNLCSDVYTLTIQDASSSCCPVVTFTTCVDFNCPIPTSMQENSIDNKSISYDLLNNSLTVNNNAPNSILNIYDITGNKVLVQELVIGNNKTDLSFINSGIYIVNVLSDGSIVNRKKIVKN